ncbi:kelch motif domain-containing protein, putative [Eimeria acervulina]|uniref:Kelch motif domain-containing protein, putative n=1 Tax=Eimeria acervulina TaxID=5801 RepID=U6GAE6_EIMAC|nr:kelch motif domain-containing protein, putative [Eimeria acervulina]CDI76318.1 kelch motif domain-containing protein, putative [Eimeria acervulina]
MAPPKGNTKKAQQKAARRELQQKKAAAKEQKKKQKKGEVECDETPIDVLLQQLEEEHRQRQISKTQATLCNQPSPRAHASLTLLPSGDFLLFGGESYDGKKVRVYGDLFKWDMDKAEWRRLEAPEMPKARCSHQAVYHNDALYVFGGEFSTYYQFHHYKDFWKFDLKSNLWSKILVECPAQVPSPRSGHRMAVWRGLLILFGGFHDTGRDTRYYNDLYVFIFSENKWRKIEFPPHTHIPEARGGCVFVVVGDVILLHGGFAKIRDTNKRVQGKIFTVGLDLAAPAIPCIPLDSWLLDLKPLAKGALTQIPTWEKIKNSGTPPSPRTGMCATAYKSSVIVFGGVADQDDGGTNLSRWYRLELKTGKKGGSKKRAPRQIGRDIGQLSPGQEPQTYESETSEASSGEENWQKTFAYFDAKGRLVKLQLEDIPEVNRAVATHPQSSPEREQNIGGISSSCGGETSTDTSTAACDVSVECEPGGAVDPPKPTEPTEGEVQHTNSKSDARLSLASVGPLDAPQAPSVFSADVPLPRLHGMICVRGSSLVLMGGLMELGNKEITLDDCWSLNLNKRDRWVRVLEGTMHEQEWQGESEAESGGGSDSEDDSNFSDTGSSESDDLNNEMSSSDEEVPNQVIKERKRHRVREEMQQLRERFGLDDPMETPAEGESLRDFFERTREYWVQKARAGGCCAKNSKEMTREAFEAASARVSAIRDALRRMDELLRLDGGQSEERDSRSNGNQTASASRHYS